MSDDADILADMVTLAEFERRYHSSLNQLLNVGWRRADVRGLLADWPGIELVHSRMLADLAALFTRFGSTPVQARSWLRVFYTVADGMPVRTEQTVNRLIADPRADGTSGLARLYTQAAGGDQAIAIQGYLAGLETGELADLVNKAGGDVMTRLMGLAGLRALRTT